MSRSFQDVDFGFSIGKAFHMKTLVVFISLIFVCYGSLESKRGEIHLISGAVQSVIVKELAKHSGKLDLLVFGPPHGIAESIADKVLKNIPVNISATKTTISNFNGLPINSLVQEQIAKSTICLFESLELLNKSARQVYHFLVPLIKGGHFLLYASGMKPKNIPSFLLSHVSIASSQVGFLVNSKHSSIDLAVSYLFTPEACQIN